MRDIERHIGMCTRHHAKWKRMAQFAGSEDQRQKCLEMSDMWLERQNELVSRWEGESKRGFR